ncbi:MAG: DsbA family protein [Deltaproteobacteria bacterium]|nr:DsbA family protein [Deltaproteobacteria bacterium]
MKNALDRSSVVRARQPFSLTLVVLSVALAAIVGAAGCGRLGLGGQSGDAARQDARPGDEQVALVLEGRDVTIAELNDLMKDQFIEEFLRQPEDRQYEMREAAIRELVQRHVVEGEAKKKGITPEALYDEVTAAAPAVSVEDVSTWFKNNESRIGGARLEEVAPQIEQMLQRERKGEAWSAFLDPKLEGLDWAMKLAPPRKNVEATRLVRGPAEAPVTLITFSDYQCPYCIRSEKTLAEVLAKYPKDVRLVHRHFPLDQIHPLARPAAEAAMCADEQGRFWAFHDAIFALSGQIEEASFAAIGAKLGLDGKALETCMAERRFKEFVETDVQAGELAGVTGTPAFFVNGIPLKGSRDLDDLSRVIDGELARVAKP